MTTPMHHPITPDIIARLGTISDRLLAAEARVDTETIRRARRDRRIPASRAYVKWSPEMDSKLGTGTDEDVANGLGVKRMAVTMRRQRLGISPLRPIHLSYLKGEGSTSGVVTLTAHVSEEVRRKADDLREPLLAKYKASGLPMREITMWQVMEFAVNKLHSEMLP